VAPQLRLTILSRLKGEAYNAPLNKIRAHLYFRIAQWKYRIISVPIHLSTSTDTPFPIIL